MHWCVPPRVVPFGFEQVAHAQDVAGSAVDLAEEVRDMPVSSTIRLLFILTALTFFAGDDSSDDAIHSICYCVLNDAPSDWFTTIATQSSIDWFELVFVFDDHE